MRGRVDTFVRDLVFTVIEGGMQAAGTFSGTRIEVTLTCGEILIPN